MISRMRHSLIREQKLGENEAVEMMAGLVREAAGG